ncbi:hypothetical protein [Beggiatoa leptomitoformis]|uniref:Uncharacterized protein n=1 Tax=Beggiatoa leptomitoformis TaxID=288004 RepID=A0A2N9YDF7_9GAMM|nr:hypothetical protein [Beggiatoa leptomitoformis]ALG69092.1 hypothetical protein AL038_17120 [Beggiatoa leptomitoformis]AUI68496.1 hypothetical protein BLE401_07120 [Beggiatoa leptomitoformis]
MQYFTRYTHYLLIIFSIILLTLSACTSLTSTKPTTSATETFNVQLSEQDALMEGYKIWQNESGAKIEGLTAWNAGEDFASLGIGHFIWYPAGKIPVFTEGFPLLIQFMRTEKVDIPAWLINTPHCPWATREAFNSAINSNEMLLLRTFLHETLPVQVQFMAQRVEQSLPTLLATLPTDIQKEKIRTQFYRVAQSANGIYALIDYVNFKGEGVSTTERYNGQGWGLLQVLDKMAGNTNNPTVEFATAAAQVLTQRVQNSPVERNEKRWLAGWINRVNTYR